jgi:UPF0176 protein
VFDRRVAVNHQLEPGMHGLCHACGWPVAPIERDQGSYEEGVSCPHCIDRFSEADRRRFRQRQRQMGRGHQQGGAE